MEIESYWVPGTGSRLAQEWAVPILATCAAYIPTILLLQRFMANRKPMELRRANICWNAVLSILSILGFLIMVVEDPSLFGSVLKEEGDYKPMTRSIVALFCLTKVVEFGDTLFLVLKKKQLTFLHVYHHFSVALYCFHSQWSNVSFAHIFVAMNLFVHGVMYGYFFLSAILGRRRFLNLIRPHITSIQLIQMFVGIAVSIYAVYTPAATGWWVHEANAKASIFMYLSYAYLFAVFYVDQYHKAWRSTVSVFLTTAHLMALAGAIRIAYHPNWRRLTAETVGLYILSGFGITCGAHRLWAHQSYKASGPFRTFLMILNSLANQGTILHWSRDHRVHHIHSEQEADPHNAKRGFWYSHCGWLLLKKPQAVIDAGKVVDMSDLLADPVVRFQQWANPWWNLFVCFFLPALYGRYVYNDFLLGLLTVGTLRWCLCLHATWCVNSVAHLYGPRPYEPADVGPAESWFTSLVADGEGWHNWHHLYPFDYAASEMGVLQQYNPSKLLIDTAAMLGMVWDRRRATGMWQRLKSMREEKLNAAVETAAKEASVTLADVTAEIPPQCQKTSTTRSTVDLVRDLLVLTLIAGASAYANQFDIPSSWGKWASHAVSSSLFLVYSVSQGTAAVGVWALGYEAACGRFSRSEWLNGVVGFILHSVCLVPYKSRRAYVDTEKEEAFLSRSMDQDAFAMVKVGRMSSSPLGTAGVIGLIACLHQIALVYGQWSVIRWYIAPVTVTHIWLVVYHNLLESSPLSVGVEQQKPNMKALSPNTAEYFTLDWLKRNVDNLQQWGAGMRVVKWISDHFHHRLTMLNVLEAVDFRVPHYHAREAFKALSRALGGKEGIFGKTEAPPSLSSLDSSTVSAFIERSIGS